MKILILKPSSLGDVVHALPVLRLDTIELVEDPLEIGWRYPGPLVDDLDLDEFPVAFGSDIDTAGGRGVFRGIIEQIEDDLLKQRCVAANQRQAGCNVDA